MNGLISPYMTNLPFYKLLKRSSPYSKRFQNRFFPVRRSIFYFIVTVAITHKIVDSYLAAIDSSILDSHANPFHKTLTGNCKTCPYAETCTHPAECVSEDVNASFTSKHGKHYYGHKVHPLVDSVSNLVMGLFVSTSSLNDNPLFIP